MARVRFVLQPLFVNPIASAPPHDAIQDHDLFNISAPRLWPECPSNFDDQLLPESVAHFFGRLAVAEYHEVVAVPPDDHVAQTVDARAEVTLHRSHLFHDPLDLHVERCARVLQAVHRL